MARREPKSTQETIVTVIGKDEKKKGTLKLSSGNISYYRKNAKSETARFTLQQLIELIESKLEIEDLIERKGSWPKNGKTHDFFITVSDSKGNQIFESSQKRDSFDLEEYYAGSYVIDSGNCQRFPKNGYQWTATMSVFGCISMLDDYINDVMKTKRQKDVRDSEHPISKNELIALLAQWQKDINS